MNKTPRLSKSGIEYLDYQWGIFSGCENWANGICPVPNCWARSIAHRFPNHYPDGFNPHYYPEAIDSPKHLKKPSRIGVGWVGDVIGYCNSRSIAREDIERTIKECPQHTFLFLTKNPEKLFRWSPFPDNCWVGGTVTNWGMLPDTLYNLKQLGNTTTFISFEPLLEFIPIDGLNLVKHLIKWVIIGSQTKPYKPPKIEWVQEIVEACDKAGIPVFLKNNLKPLLQQNEHNLYSFPEWAGPQFAITGDYSLAPVTPHSNEAMRKLRQEMPF